MVRVIPQSLWLQAYVQLASLGLCDRWGECANSFARRSVCWLQSERWRCQYSCGLFLLPVASMCEQDTSLSLFEIIYDLCFLPSVTAASVCVCVGGGGRGTLGLWFLGAAISGRRTVWFVRLTLKFVIYNHAVFVELPEVYTLIP